MPIIVSSHGHRRHFGFLKAAGDDRRQCEHRNWNSRQET